MIVNLILTDIYINPLFSHPAHPPNSIAPLITLLHPLHLPSYPLYHPILLLSHSCIFLPDFPPLIPRPNSPATHPTLIPTKPLLSSYQLSPHYFNLLPLSPLSTRTFSSPLSPLSITQLPTLFHISHPSYPRLLYHSYIKFFLLSQPFLTPLYHPKPTPFPLSHSSHRSPTHPSPLSRPSHSILPPISSPVHPVLSSHSPN